MMWQRFQTLLLLIVAGLLLSMFMTDMCYTLTETGRFAIRFIDRSQFLIFTFTTFVLAELTIANFKRRLLQIRICIINAILLTAYQIWILIEFFKLKEVYSITVPALFPVICVILLVLAIRYIGRDEAMVMIHGTIVKHKKNKRKH